MKRHLLFLATTAVVAAPALAEEIDFLCYQDGRECEVIAELSEAFTAETGHVVNVTTVGYDIIRDQLENQLAGAEAPDVARVTNLGGLNQYYLDLSPYVDTAAWEANYGATLSWFRKSDGSDADAIYGWVTGLTVTGPYVNVTHFEDAGVAIPGEGATWDDWAAALGEVKDILGYGGLAMDRTAHRWAGPAFSYGAQFYDADGNYIIVDDGFRSYAETFKGWHDSGLMPQEGWPAGADTEYRNAAPLFTSQAVTMHMSGSWMISNYDANITDFEWAAVPIPCGPGGCGAMPGGAALVAFNSTDVPEAAALFIDFMAREDKAAAFAVATKNITAHQGLQASASVSYEGVSPAVANALSVFAANAGKAARSTPQAFTFQGDPNNFAVYGIIPDFITQAIRGEISLEDAYAAINASVAASVAAGETVVVN